MESSMKFIPAVLLALSLSAIGTSACAAQQQPEPGAQGRERAGMGGLILQGITLTEAQKTQQKAIREKYAPQLMAVRKTAQTTGTPMDEAKLTEIRSAQVNELRAILTAEQQAIFDRNVAEMKTRRAERGEK
jgi:Spy/CpxP family protein refolding chaperone